MVDCESFSAEDRVERVECVREGDEICIHINKLLSVAYPIERGNVARNPYGISLGKMKVRARVGYDFIPPQYTYYHASVVSQ